MREGKGKEPVSWPSQGEGVLGGERVRWDRENSENTQNKAGAKAGGAAKADPSLPRAPWLFGVEFLYLKLEEKERDGCGGLLSSQLFLSSRGSDHTTAYPLGLCYVLVNAVISHVSPFLTPPAPKR